MGRQTKAWGEAVVTIRSTAEGIPGHHYRFESILKSRYLIKDKDADMGYSFSGGDLPFDSGDVHEFDANVKAKDYTAYPIVPQTYGALQ
jgi:hypothetical protein